MTTPGDWATATGIHSPATGRNLPAAKPAAAEAPPAKPAGHERTPPEPPPARIEEAVRQIQDFLHKSQRQLEFQVDSHSGHTIIRVLNPLTGELIRQIPGDEVIQLARQMTTHAGQAGSIGLIDDSA